MPPKWGLFHVRNKDLPWNSDHAGQPVPCSLHPFTGLGKFNAWHVRKTSEMLTNIIIFGS